MNRQNNRTQLSAMPTPVRKKKLRERRKDESLSPPIVNISFCVLHTCAYTYTYRRIFVQ